MTLIEAGKTSVGRRDSSKGCAQVSDEIRDSNGKQNYYYSHDVPAKKSFIFLCILQLGEEEHGIERDS